jgi:transcriptional regulator with XRE-family HTH domain
MKPSRRLQPPLVKALRERRRLTEAQLANRVGVHRTWIQRLEDTKPDKVPDIAHSRLQALADALVVGVDAIAPRDEPEWTFASWLNAESDEAIFRELEDSNVFITIGTAFDAYLLPDSINELLDRSSVAHLTANPKLIPAWQEWARMYRAQQLEVRKRRSDYLHLTIAPESSLAALNSNKAARQILISNIEQHRRHTVPFIVDRDLWDYISGRICEVPPVDVWDKIMLFDEVLLNVRLRRTQYAMTYHPATILHIKQILLTALNIKTPTQLTPFAIEKTVERAIRRIARSA